MITISHKGSFENTERFLSRARRLQVQSILERYGREGVEALAASTPKDSGKTASSWTYRIEFTRRGYRLIWWNTHEENGVSPAILIQYGHGTGTGGYVPPRDYINPAMAPIFNNIAESIWKEVRRL